MLYASKIAGMVNMGAWLRPDKFGWQTPRETYATLSARGRQAPGGGAPS